MRSIAIIPARSGSKELRHKNIKLINNKPLIAYSIESALTSSCFDKVIVSTDSSMYAEIAEQYGAEVPFLRSAENSSDQATSWSVVREVLSYYKQKSDNYDVAALLQPTSPLRSAQDIREAFSLFTKNEAEAIVAVCKTEHSPLLTNVLPENQSMHSFIDLEKIGNLRSNYECFYRINGAIYIVSCSSENFEKKLYSDKSFAYIMPIERSVDIDSIIDFEYAEFLMKRGNYSNE